MPASRRQLAALFCAAVFVQGCATSSALHNARDQFYSGQPQKALETLDAGKVSSRDQLLLLLDKGLIAHTAGDYNSSIKSFLAAKALLDSKDFVSVKEQSAALVTNEWSGTYKGEYSERLWIHSFQMMNFLLSNNAESAAIEARQALKVLDRHNKALQDDWFTRALVAMSFEAAGKPDSAHIEYRKLFDDMGYDGGIARIAWQNAKRLGRDNDASLFAQQLPDGTRTGDGRGELVVFVEQGAIPRKVAGDLWLRSDLRAAFPVYPDFTSNDIRVTVSTNGQPVHADTVKTELVNISRSSLATRGTEIAIKQVARLAAKHELIRQARKESEGLGALVGFTMFVLEQADTRSWETLPANLALVQVPLGAGNHTIELDITDGTGVIRRTLSNVTISPGRRSYRALRVGPGAPASLPADDLSLDNLEKLARLPVQD